MFFASRPSPDRIDTFIRDSHALPLSYEPNEIALTRTASRWNHDRIAAPIGNGHSDFDRACGALKAWKQFDLGWLELFPARPPVDVGTVVAVLITHLGFWSLNGCRVVSRNEDHGPSPRFSVSYGTLTNHAESGEERFEVSMDQDSREVTFRIRAVSRPRAALARLGYPVTRRLQARFGADALDAMKRAMAR
jgi:uncharacterized protein (UPF0548 family)